MAKSAGERGNTHNSSNSAAEHITRSQGLPEVAYQQSAAGSARSMAQSAGERSILEVTNNSLDSRAGHRHIR
jgi:hypothetical protein